MLEPAVSTLFSMQGISKRFGGTQALDDVGFLVHSGQIVSLLGENGAGKSTLIKILAGIHKADDGLFHFCEKQFNPINGHDEIAFIHQDLGLIEWMTVAENICLLKHGYPRRLGLIDWKAVEEKSNQALLLIAEYIDVNVRVQQLSRTEKSLVAIARALACDAKLLVLDEPTASLPQFEVDILHQVLRKLKTQGVGIIYVSHRLDEIFAISDRVVILRDGRLVADKPLAGIQQETLIKLIIGRNLDAAFVPPTLIENTPSTLVLDKVCIDDVGPISFALGQGEIIGLSGLRGAGQDMVGKVLFGLIQPSSGEIHLTHHKVFHSNHPQESIEQGIAMVAGERVLESILTGLLIQENLFANPKLTGRKCYSFTLPSKEAQSASQLGSRFDIRPNNPAAVIETLSGGNQQKVIIARWLSIGCSVLILDDPTAGVDVGSKAEIYQLLGEAIKQGLSIILISTDFEEVATLCHRAYIFRDGSITRELQSQTLSVEKLLSTASLEPSEQYQ
ncbi:MAG: sugar ABC transporter ATP-binding protein [Ostreibacterium sp.]